MRYLWFWENSLAKFDFQRLVLEWVLIAFFFVIHRLASPLLSPLQPFSSRRYFKTAAACAAIDAFYAALKFYGEPAKPELTPDSFMEFMNRQHSAKTS